MQLLPTTVAKPDRNGVPILEFSDENGVPEMHRMCTTQVKHNQGLCANISN